MFTDVKLRSNYSPRSLVFAIGFFTGVVEIIPIGEIQEFLFDSRDPSRNMEPIQTMLAFLPKPGAYHPSQSIFAIRQDDCKLQRPSETNDP